MKNTMYQDTNEFEILDLRYMKQVSRGDMAYERKVTRLFIELIPDNLAGLQSDYELRDYVGIRKTLHHMQSSLSIMGLSGKLMAYMDLDLFEPANSFMVKENIDFITEVCIKAVEEAKQYLIKLEEK